MEASPAAARLSAPLLNTVGDDGAAVEAELAAVPSRGYSRTAVAVLALITVCDAIEYGLIMPSLYAYIHEVSGDKYDHADVQALFGAALSIFSATSFACKPAFGYAADRTRYSYVYLFSMTIAIVGNLLYAYAATAGAMWMVLAGRALSGIGCANSSLSFSHVSRTVPERSRTSVMTMLGMSFPIGLLLGPGLNALTSAVDLEVLGVRVNANNAPGLLIALVLLVLLALVLLLLHEPAAYNSHEHAPRPEGWLGTLRAVGAEAARPPVLRCVFCIFLFNLYITTIEALVVPVTQHTFGFKPLQNSFVYLGTAVEVITLSMGVMAFSKRTSDSGLVALSCAVCVLSLGFNLRYWTYDMPLWRFIVGEAMCVAAIPFAFAPNRARFSKLTRTSRLQGLLQSLMSSVASVGSILGPLYLSATLGAPTSAGPIAQRTFAGLALLSGVLLLWEVCALTCCRAPRASERDAAGRTAAPPPSSYQPPSEAVAAAEHGAQHAPAAAAAQAEA